MREDKGLYAITPSEITPTYFNLVFPMGVISLGVIACTQDRDLNNI